MLRLITIFMLIGSMSFAETWQKRSNDEIKKTLNGKTLKYSQATQVFYSDGRTLYETQIPTHGKWRALNDQYCSIWPPAVMWVCYDLETDITGKKVRFIAKNGSIDVGHYID